MPSYIVLWSPREIADRTVDRMKVIDAWSSSHDMDGAHATMQAHSGEYLGLHGPGILRVMRSDVPEYEI